MAYRQQVPASWLKDSPNTAKLVHFYSVDQAVGVNSPNKREDVMLVQLMMSVIAATKLYIAGQIPWNYPPIRVDGNGDQRMIARIYTYQLMNSSGLTINGRVDPAKTKEFADRPGQPDAHEPQHSARHGQPDGVPRSRGGQGRSGGPGEGDQGFPAVAVPERLSASEPKIACREARRAPAANSAEQGCVRHDTRTLSFPQKQESRATAQSLALDPRFRGGDKFKCGTFNLTLLQEGGARQGGAGDGADARHGRGRAAAHGAGGGGARRDRAVGRRHGEGLRGAGRVRGAEHAAHPPAAAPPRAGAGGLPPAAADRAERAPCRHRRPAVRGRLRGAGGAGGLAVPEADAPRRPRAADAADGPGAQRSRRHRIPGAAGGAGRAADAGADRRDLDDPGTAVAGDAAEAAEARAAESDQGQNRRRRPRPALRPPAPRPARPVAAQLRAGGARPRGGGASVLAAPAAGAARLRHLGARARLQEMPRPPQGAVPAPQEAAVVPALRGREAGGAGGGFRAAGGGEAGEREAGVR